jgi:hypothetical protein
MSEKNLSGGKIIRARFPQEVVYLREMIPRQGEFFNEG